MFKKILKIILSFGTLCFIIAVLGFVFHQTNPVHAAAKLSVPNIVLNVGDTYQLKMKGATGTFKWTSSNALAAKVVRDSKKKTVATVTAKAEGIAIITAKKGKKQYQCMVVVMKPVSTEPEKDNTGSSDNIGDSDNSSGEVIETTKAYKNISVFEKSGTVNVTREKKKISAVKDMKLKNYDYLTVAKKSFLRICMDNDVYVYLEEGSEAAVAKAWFNKSKIALTKGELIVEVQKKLEGDDSFTVITPNTNMAIRGTVVAVKTTPQKDGSCKTINYVLEGSVEVTLANNKKITLKAGEGWETTTNKKGKVTESKKTDASDLDFKGIDVKQLKGADGAEIIINKGGSGKFGSDDSGSNGDDNNTGNGDSGNNNGSGNGDSNNGSDTAEAGYYNGKVKIGDIIKLGKYEQDNNTGNGTEDIEWVVLSVEDDKALVLSKYALDRQSYNQEYMEITWEECTLRKWLNDDFYNAAFSKSEKSMIKTTRVKTNDNPVYGTQQGSKGGNDTEDKIFLLSLDDITNISYGFSSDYSENDINRRCAVTAYALAEGAYQSSVNLTSEGKGATDWWLRSPGIDADNAAYVSNAGSADYYGDDDDYQYAIRPALWINLKP
ncbi:MAG: FecR domain-containing protein [Lachnospiraceae bacterium]|nr:FecR domain-containing protein [Lachnospiraceae bacterium]